MRVAVIGATGNAGTAVLRALKATPEVSEIIGVARRLPDDSVEPYVGCRWEPLDIAATSSEEEAVGRLTELLHGVSAVIHLAWLIQPNGQRELLRRVNVDGTARVARAVAAAGVPHLIVACSVGAYSPDDARAEDGEVRLRDEDWPTGGIPTSHYSVDKADQERVLDVFSTAHPEVTVARVRPALIFQADAASEIQRYFLGLHIPVQLLKVAKPPVLPLPKGLLLQAVHADDVARGYAAIVAKRAAGAFNLCADDILGPQELADLVDHGRYVELPVAAVRASVAAAHKAGTIAADEGWLDMGMQVPLMDNARAKRELGWQPQFTAAEALAELLEGMIEGHGMASPPLQPRNPDEVIVTGIHEPASRGARAGSRVRSDKGPPRLPEQYSPALFNLYLSDHLTGATAGAGRIARMASDFADTPVFAQLSVLASEIRAERSFLRQLILDLGMRPKRYRQAIAWVGERIGRLKGNGRIVHRSPLTMLLETELMRSAVHGKLGLWETLSTYSDVLQLDREVFTSLIEAGKRQLTMLDDIHAYARRHAFLAGPHPYAARAKAADHRPIHAGGA